MTLWAAYAAGFRWKAAFRYGRETKRCQRIRLANLNRPLRLEKANFNFRQKTRGSLLAHLRKRFDSLGLHDFKMDVQLVRFSKEESDSKDKLSWRVVGISDKYNGSSVAPYLKRWLSSHSFIGQLAFLQQ